MTELTDPQLAAFQAAFPTELADPQLAAFWASDPSRLDVSAPVPAGQPSHRRLLEAGVAIGAAFLVVRKLVSDRLPEQPPPDLSQALHAAFEHHAPIWMRLAVPAIKEAYALGATKDLTFAEITGLASQYAAGLGDYLDQTSAEALQEGFYTQLNAKWNERVAWERARAAYGLDKRQMSAYIQSVMRGSEAGRAEPVPLLARAFIDRMLAHRAQTLGDNEAWRAARSGEGLTWAILQDRGVLPAGSKKRWLVSPSETTCGVCYALNDQEVGLEEAFELEGAKFYAPGAHPGCRCRMELVVPLEKAYNPNEPRDWRGRWATRRDARPALALRPLPQPQPEPEPEPTPESKPIFERSQPIYGPNRAIYGQGQGSIFAQQPIFRDKPIFAEKTAQAGKQPKAGEPQRFRPVLWKKPPIPPPPGGGDGGGGGIYALDFDDYSHDFRELQLYDPSEAVWRYPRGLSFSKLETKEPIQPSVYHKRKPGRRQIEDVSDLEWGQIVAKAQAVRELALDAENNHYKDVLDNFKGNPQLLADIGQRSGFGTRGQMSVYEYAEDVYRQIEYQIVTPEAQLHRENQDLGLREAYADFVAFAVPSFAGPEGMDLQLYLEDHSSFSASPLASSAPIRLLVFKGLTPRDEKNGILRGEYSSDGTTYRSMIGIYGSGAPNGVIGVQETYLKPEFDPVSVWPPVHEPDASDLAMDDQWMADMLRGEEPGDEDEW